MARGLDVPELNLVVNFDCPNHMEDYVHRVGRTGRAGRKGWAYTFITPEEDKYAPDLVKALKASNAEIPSELNNMADGTYLSLSLSHIQRTYLTHCLYNSFQGQEDSRISTGPWKWIRRQRAYLHGD